MAETLQVTYDDKSKSYKIINNIHGQPPKLCLEYNFIEDEEDEEDGETVLYISKIFKCSDSKTLTRELIKMIEHMAKTNPHQPWTRVKYIKLEDGSSINVCARQNSSSMNIDLRYLKILTTGKSWYNSFGYKSVNHEDDVAYNARIINQPMQSLLQKLYDSDGIQEFKDIFPELSTELTVQQYVTAMLKEVPRAGTINCTEDQENKVELLSTLVDIMVKNEMLRYNVRLRKKVERAPTASPTDSPKAEGGAKRTMRKSRRKTRTRKCINAKRHKMHCTKSNHWNKHMKKNHK